LWTGIAVDGEGCVKADEVKIPSGINSDGSFKADGNLPKNESFGVDAANKVNIRVRDRDLRSGFKVLMPAITDRRVHCHLAV
jgi:hypothetical protein